MQENEKLRFLMSVREHFHIATDADGEMLWRDLRRYPLAVAKGALEEHHRECGREAFRPDVRRVAEIARQRGAGIAPTIDPVEHRRQERERLELEAEIGRLSEGEVRRIWNEVTASYPDGVRERYREWPVDRIRRHGHFFVAYKAQPVKNRPHFITNPIPASTHSEVMS